MRSTVRTNQGLKLSGDSVETASFSRWNFIADQQCQTLKSHFPCVSLFVRKPTVKHRLSCMLFILMAGAQCVSRCSLQETGQVEQWVDFLDRSLTLQAIPTPKQCWLLCKSQLIAISSAGNARFQHQVEPKHQPLFRYIFTVG